MLLVGGGGQGGGHGKGEVQGAGGERHMWFVAIVKSIEIVDEVVKVGLRLVDMASNSLPGVSANYLFMEEGFVMQAVGMGSISSTG